MAIIAVPDLASYLRDPSLAGSDVELVIELANGLVEEIVGVGLTPIPPRVKAITLEVAARAWRNPNGYSSETVDDYTYRRDAETRQAGVYLTPGERAELQAVDAPVSGAYSIDLGTPAL